MPRGCAKILAFIWVQYRRSWRRRTRSGSDPMHRHCHHDSLLWLVLVAMILNDGDKQPSQPSNEQGAGCAGALLLLVVLLIGVLVVLGNTRPDPSVPPTVTSAVYVEPEPFQAFAQRPILVKRQVPK